MKTSLSGRLLMFAAPFALVLSACGDRGAPTQAPAPAEASTPAADKPAGKKAPRTYPADYTIDAPIPKGAIKTRMQLIGEPVYVAKEDRIEFTVQVFNDGRTAIVGAGKAPVNLAVNLVGPEGVDKAPGSRSFFRKKLPLIAEGKSSRMRVRVPAKDIDGLTLRLELVQEGVSWWSRYKQPTIDLGPFHACADPAAGICDADEIPLEAR